MFNNLFDYFYSMEILSRNKTEIPKKYIFIAALLFSLAVIVQVSGTEQSPSTGLFLRRFILFGSVYFFWALFLDHINAVIKPFHEDKSKLLQVSERFISCILLVLLNLIATNIIYYSILIYVSNLTIGEAYIDFQPYILKSVIIRFFDLIVIGLILKTIESYQGLQKEKLKVVSLENQLHVSQLEILRNQLNPHFLFNTLHTLNTLIGYDDKKARAMVIKITKLLRKILDNRAKHLIEFDEELDYFINYLEIEEERFHDRLEVIIDVKDNTKDIMVPTLMLQPLIENAFKHGIAHLENKGTINLKAYLNSGDFIISLSNDIPKRSVFDPAVSTKIGLQNLKSRLEQVYDEGFTLITKKEDTQFIVTIKIKINK